MWLSRAGLWFCIFFYSLSYFCILLLLKLPYDCEASSKRLSALFPRSPIPRTARFLQQSTKPDTGALRQKKRQGNTLSLTAPDLRQHRTEIARQISSIIFCQIDKIDAGILTYFKEILAKMTENLPEDGVQSRQAVAQRCCLKFCPIATFIYDRHRPAPYKPKDWSLYLLLFR